MTNQHPMIRPFTVDDLLEVREFALEHLAVIEERHRREPGETPEEYFSRISALPNLDTDVSYELGFLHGVIAGVGGNLDQLLNQPSDTPPSTRRLRVL